MAAQFMAAGFVHGVLNSDNINITGESFDYGPWRFAPTFDASFTAAYFDQSGLYAFGRQAEAIHWDCVQLAVALHGIADHDALAASVEVFAPVYRAAIVATMLARLGVVPRRDDTDAALVAAIERALVDSQVPIDRFFFDWRGGDLRTASPPYADDDFAALRAHIAPYAAAGMSPHAYWSDADPCSMLIDEVEAIWRPIAANDDWSLLDAKIAAVRRMGNAMALPL